jgi:hypothetical protein
MNRRRRGAEAVEFALVFPIFIALVMGGIEFSWYLAQNAAMTLAVRAGARGGAVSSDELAVDGAVAQATATWTRFGFPGTPDFTATTLEGTRPALRIECVGTLGYQSMTGLIPPLADITRRSEMYLEDQADVEWP